ncbi:MAG: DUF4405 domain-containing protein [Lachnospiraceae bacterium]|nr:DUF4405 domain-containing protein [Lachnospiraceae bacterium]
MKTKIINKNLFKLLLDVLMLIVFVLMFDKESLGMSFHEIGGLILFGIFLLHILINHKWVCNVSRRFFSKGLPAKVRLRFIVDLLLLISFIFIGISGILISKVVFDFHAAEGWKAVHYFASACTLVLMGVHLYLNASFIASPFKKYVKSPQRVLKGLGILFATAVFAFGVYNIGQTKFSEWITMPFIQSERTEIAKDIDGTDKGGGNQNGNFGSPAEERDEADQQKHGGPNAKRDGSGNTYGEGDGITDRGKGGSPFETIAQFLSIIFVFACISKGIEFIYKKT